MSGAEHPTVAIVTGGASDWSTGRVDDWVGTAVTVRASRIADAVVIRAGWSADPERHAELGA
ncbi:hypothetical protein [Microcella sp.]|uniref:hypothetical protein n=1 Tax=Microcella sp. TaxID=1913979 RepID=UPI00391D392F